MAEKVETLRDLIHFFDRRLDTAEDLFCFYRILAKECGAKHSRRVGLRDGKEKLENCIDGLRAILAMKVLFFETGNTTYAFDALQVATTQSIVVPDWVQSWLSEAFYAYEDSNYSRDLAQLLGLKPKGKGRRLNSFELQKNTERKWEIVWEINKIKMGFGINTDKACQIYYDSGRSHHGVDALKKYCHKGRSSTKERKPPLRPCYGADKRKNLEFLLSYLPNSALTMAEVKVVLAPLAESILFEDLGRQPTPSEMSKFLELKIPRQK